MHDVIACYIILKYDLISCSYYCILDTTKKDGLEYILTVYFITKYKAYAPYMTYKIRLQKKYKIRLNSRSVLLINRLKVIYLLVQ